MSELFDERAKSHAIRQTDGHTVYIGNDGASYTAPPPPPDFKYKFSRALVGGVRDAGQGLIDMRNEMSEILAPYAELLPTEARDAIITGMMGFTAPRTDDSVKTIPSLPEVDAPDAGVAENLLRGLVQFGTGAAAAPIKGAGLLAQMGRGAFSDALFNPEDGNLSTMLKEFGLDGAVLDFLDSQVDEDAGAEERLQARMMQSLEGAGLGALVDGAMAGFRAIRSDEGLVETVKQSLSETGAKAKAAFDALPTDANTMYSVPFGPLSDPIGKVAGEPPTLATLVDTPHPGAPRTREIADARIELQQEENKKALALGEKPKKTTNVVKIEDLATYFDEDHLATYGRKLDPTNPTDQQTAAQTIASGIDEQMTQAASGAGWYDEDVLKTFKMLSEITGLERFENDETARIIWSAMAAPTSIGQLVKNNTRAATAAAMTYFRTGVFPIKAPLKETTTEGIPNAGWGMKQKSVESGMQVIAHLIGKYGEDGFADWWLSPHSKGELTAIRKEAGLSGPPSGVSGKADSVHLGAMVLGDKTGRFSLNINGYEGTTKDVWYSRSYNRAFGQMFGAPDKKTGKPVVQGGPRNQGERREMEAFNQLVLANTKAKGLSEADAQAILWFYEQGLYTRLGVKSVPGSFSEGVGEVHGTLGVRPAVRGSDGTQTEIEPGTTLEGYRGIKPKQRAVRAQRRSVLSEFNTGTGSERPSGPYAGRLGLGSGGNEEDGLLAFVPDPAASARYNAARLTIPKINQVDAASSAQAYHDDMVAAMSIHRYGAQVEIKSPEDLATMRTFRTEGGGGFAIKDDGDVVAVFGSQSEEGSGYAMLQAAVEAGGQKLDAFNTFLPRIYGAVGFRPVARMPWNDEFAPPDWDKNVFAEYQNGEPDIVFFVHDPEYFGDMNMNDVPLLTDYDAAVALQNKALAKLGGGE